jgi:subtilisin family serine protease
MGAVPAIRRPVASGLVGGFIASLMVSGSVLAASGAASASSANPATAAYFSHQWGLSQIGAPDAWGAGTGRGVRIGIVDTGVDLAHPDLAGKVGTAATCVNTGGDPLQCVAGAGAGQDDNGHGTHVAGIAGAAGNGVAGVAPGATFVVAKVLDSSGSGNTGDVAAGIEWVVQHGAQVVNLSLGSDTGILGINCVVSGCSNSTITSAVEDAWHAGAIPVIAAGNNAGNLFGPSGYGNLDAVVVAATGRSAQLASYSSTAGNAKWGVLAPGGDDPNGPTAPACGQVDDTEILSTYWSGGQSCYATDEGTSMATPFVSGTLALLLGRGLSPQNAVQTLLATLNRSVTCGAGGGCQGLVNAAAAMAATTTPAGPAAHGQPSGNPTSPAAGAVPAPAPGAGGNTSSGSRSRSVSAHGAAAAPASGTPSPNRAGSGSGTPGQLSVGRVARAAPVAHKSGRDGPWAVLLVMLAVVLGVAVAVVWRRIRAVRLERDDLAAWRDDAPRPTDHGWEVLARR